MPFIRAFLDTNVLKYAVDELYRFAPRMRRIRWGAMEQDVTLHEPIILRPNERFDRTLLRETRLLPFVAFLAIRGRLELLWNIEVMIELLGLRDVDDPRGRFYGAPLTSVSAPFQYGRVIVSGSFDPLPPTASIKRMPHAKHRQVAFIEGIRDHRLMQLRKACGAEKTHGVDPNQLIDAFHLWTAESAGATHFLTTERRLLHLRDDSVLALSCKPVLPSELIAAVEPSLLRRLVCHLIFQLMRMSQPERWHVAA